MALTRREILGGDVDLVLVLGGGNALGAFQAGVYEGLHRAGLEPDWIIGTSIGAINGALIAGKQPTGRVEVLRGSGTRPSTVPPGGPWRPTRFAARPPRTGRSPPGAPGSSAPSCRAPGGPRSTARTSCTACSRRRSISST
ncbi:patatin-like phospholipase family protein [Aureimonas pseudogalii]|uniref:PNPLA domain-containing protein n=1 Tax=Aureimonas pseudogalii TaxID=1744844 RepID=A0A7W6EAF1_9HYPH|nr:patatin-like phospholipase family protein [Aureimonas pseudogalii]MBB3997269.1 hypothetical protein [Aureimonas pseudogalii]